MINAAGKDAEARAEVDGLVQKDVEWMREHVSCLTPVVDRAGKRISRGGSKKIAGLPEETACRA